MLWFLSLLLGEVTSQPLPNCTFIPYGSIVGNTEKLIAPTVTDQCSSERDTVFYSFKFTR